MDAKRRRPGTSLQEAHRAVILDFPQQGSYQKNTGSALPRQGIETSIIVECVIGSRFIAFRTDTLVIDPRHYHYEFRPIKTGPRCGRLHRVRIIGKILERRIESRRFSEPNAGVQFYLDHRHFFGVGALPFTTDAQRRCWVFMSWPMLTKAGAASAWAISASQMFRVHGIGICSEPTWDRAFWFADY